MILLALVRNRVLCQVPRSWCHNAISWWRLIQNITSFRHFEWDTLSDVKITDKYWLNFVHVVLTSRDKDKTVLLRSTKHSEGCPEADFPRDLWWTLSANNAIFITEARMQLSITKLIDHATYNLMYETILNFSIYISKLTNHPLPLFRVRSWNSGVRCMSFYILMVSRPISLEFPNLSQQTV